MLGSRGFVGAAIVRYLSQQSLPLLALGRKDVDLLSEDASSVLAARLRGDDSVVFVSALAPCRDIDTLMKNLRMAQAVCSALQAVEPTHVTYISSDAVYADTENPVTEKSCRDPATLHGMMHSVRELLLRSSTQAPLAVLRPSLLYGADDPHNGYGPNRFRRTALSDGKITLFGGGEERRDHVYVDDLAVLVSLCLTHQSRGELNVATGNSVSFREVADMVAAHFSEPVKVVPTPRQNPITHRHFDITATLKAFPRFHPTALADGVARVHREVRERQ